MTVIDQPIGTMAVKGTLEWVPVDAFTSDAAYNRDPNEARIRFMAEHWKDEAVGVLFASRRSDTELILLDGQHRSGALRMMGRKKDLVPTFLFDGLTQAQEAELFVMMNKNRRALTPSELFKASLVEGDQGAIEIQAVMNELGLRLESRAAQTDRLAVKCINTVWRVYRAMGKEGIDSVFGLILVTWGEPPPKRAFDQRLVLCLAKLLFYGENELDIDHLRIALAKEQPDELLSRADTISALQGGDRVRVVGDTILSMYNKGLNVRKQLDPQIMQAPRNKDIFTDAAKFRRSETKT